MTTATATADPIPFAPHAAALYAVLRYERFAERTYNATLGRLWDQCPSGSLQDWTPEMRREATLNEAAFNDRRDRVARLVAALAPSRVMDRTLTYDAPIGFGGNYAVDDAIRAAFGVGVQPDSEQGMGMIYCHRGQAAAVTEFLTARGCAAVGVHRGDLADQPMVDWRGVG